VNPIVIVCGFAVFVACLIAHVVIWRFRVPKNDALMLFVLFLFVPAVIFSGVAALGIRMFPGNLSGTELLLVLMLHFGLSMVYISSYPAAQAISPSLKIMLLIPAAPEKKMTADEIFRYFEDQKIIMKRVEELSDYNLITCEKDQYRLKPAAVRLIRMYLFYRRLIGLPVGKG